MTAEGQTEVDAQANGSKPRPTGTRGVWDAVIFLLAAAALIGLAVYTVHHYAKNATDAATILGIVVPAFVTIGAAAFGLRVAYTAGQAKGHVAGQNAASEQLATEFLPRIQSARSAVDEVFDLLRERSLNPPGRNTMVLGLRPRDATFALDDDLADLPFERAPIQLDPQPLEKAREELVELQGLAAGLRRGAG